MTSPPFAYPPPRYHGERGEVTAVHRPVDQEPDLVYGSGTTVHYLSSGAATGGRFGLYRWDMGAEPSGPDPHFHRSITESFFVLSGTVRLYDGARWVDATAGHHLYVPEGGIHAFRNESGEPASMLLLFTPGAPREGYFEGLVGLGTASPDERAAFFLQHDNVWL